MLVLLPACNNERNESDACIQLRDQAYKAALGNQLNEGRSLLGKAKSVCGTASDYYLDRVQRVLERIARREAQTQTQTVETEQSPLSGFVDWIGRMREAQNKAVGKHQCAPRDSKRFGFCESQTQLGGATYELTYSREDPNALRFSYQSSGLLSCIDLGEHRDVSRWSFNGVSYESCALSGHSQRGLSALITQQAGRSAAIVYSAEYKELDADFRELLER